MRLILAAQLLIAATNRHLLFCLSNDSALAGKLPRHLRQIPLLLHALGRVLCVEGLENDDGVPDPVRNDQVDHFLEWCDGLWDSIAPIRICNLILIPGKKGPKTSRISVPEENG